MSEASGLLWNRVIWHETGRQHIKRWQTRQVQPRCLCEYILLYQPQPIFGNYFSSDAYWLFSSHSSVAHSVEKFPLIANNSTARPECLDWLRDVKLDVVFYLTRLPFPFRCDIQINLLNACRHCATVWCVLSKFAHSVDESSLFVCLFKRNTITDIFRCKCHVFL